MRPERKDVDTFMSMQQREYTTPQAHERFGGHLKYRTAVRRAQLAFKKPDKRIRLVGGTFVAPEAFWKEIFARPATRGRPSKDEQAADEETRDARLG
jgi:hypothetical protein